MFHCRGTFQQSGKRVTLNKSSHEEMSNYKPGRGRRRRSPPWECCGFEAEKAQPWPWRSSWLLGEGGTRSCLTRSGECRESEICLSIPISLFMFQWGFHSRSVPPRKAGSSPSLPSTRIPGRKTLMAKLGSHASPSARLRGRGGAPPLEIPPKLRAAGTGWLLTEEGRARMLGRWTPQLPITASSRSSADIAFPEPPAPWVLPSR